MFTKYLALLSESESVQFAEVAQIAAALQKQITRDFTPIWQVPATIDAFVRLEEVPSDYWPIIIQDNIGFNAAGIHLDRNGQPFALVQAGSSTALTCSHETVEMLVDPFGNRFVASQSIMPGQGRVNYLVEACDPSEGEHFGYSVNGILLSDFYTPNYFDPVFSPSVRYSFTGALTKPREVLQDGYISWMVPETGEWFQATFFGPSLQFRSLGVIKKKVTQSWRETIDMLTVEPLKKLGESNLLKTKNLSEVMLATSLKESFTGRARQLREDIAAVLFSATVGGQGDILLKKIIDALADISGIDSATIANNQMEQDQNLQFDLGINRLRKRALKTFFDDILQEFESTKRVTPESCEELNTISDCVTLLKSKL